MELDYKIGTVVLIISASILFPLTIFYSEEKIDSIQIEIQEDTVFDPLCLRSSDEFNVITEFCSSQGGYWYMHLGTSTDMEYSDDTPLPKLLLMKIDLTKIPESNLATQTTVQKFELEIGFLYDAIKYSEESEERFSSHISRFSPHL